MTIKEKIDEVVDRLPLSFQQQALDFMRYLLERAERQERAEWTEAALATALQGMEDEEAGYSLADLKIRFG